ncbi:MAG: type II toxin-antitoxin system VapC family toxin [Methanomicrobia archaeon]|nr:type II toxin-antitoxin system VapC family toxin [Methanomicrobia archaeon]
MSTSSSSILVDSFAWLEILQGSERGRAALNLIRQSEKVFISVLNLYELRYRIEQLKDEQTANEFLKTIQVHAKTINVDDEIALQGAQLKLKYGLGAIDSLLLATARVHNLKLLTGDKHFETMPDAILI